MKEYYLIYLRKSRQDNESETVEEVLNRHEIQLQDFAIRLFGHKISDEFIYREIVSGETIADRPEFQKMLTRIQDENCKGVLVIEAQRLTRGDLTDLGNVVSAFRYSKTLVLTPPKTFDLENKYDREFFERELLRGKDYIEYTKEILMRGRKASAHEGNYVASIPPYGYDRLKVDKYWTLVINEKEADMVRMIFDMYVNQGMGASLISQKLNELGAKPRMSERFAPTAIRQILSNEVYIGLIRWNAKPVVKVYENGQIIKKRTRNKSYELIKGKHKSIITEELFYKAQERKKNSTREKAGTELKNPFAGLIKCKKCGGSIALRPYNKNGKAIRKPRYYCRSGVYCDCKSSNADIVNDAIIQTLKKYLQDFKIKLKDNVQSDIDQHEKMVKALEKNLANLEIKQTELYDLLEEKVYTKEVFLMRNEKLAQERKELQEKIKKAKEFKPSVDDTRRKYYSLYEALNALEDESISAKAKNNLLKNIVEVIYYLKNENGIELEVILK